MTDLTITERARLVVIAHETMNEHLRDAALAVLAEVGEHRRIMMQNEQVLKRTVEQVRSDGQKQWFEACTSNKSNWQKP